MIWFSTLTITNWEYLALKHVENVLCPVSVNIQPRFHSLGQNEQTYPSHSYANCLWRLIKSKITCLSQITLAFFFMIYFLWMFDLCSCYFIWLWSKGCIKFHECEGITGRHCLRSPGLNCRSSYLTKMLSWLGLPENSFCPVYITQKLLFPRLFFWKLMKLVLIILSHLKRSRFLIPVL